MKVAAKRTARRDPGGAQAGAREGHASDRRKPRVLDVRPLLMGGIEPLPAILAALDGLGKDGTLMLITPFLPSPLIERVHPEGFAARPERRFDGAWVTQFTRE